MTKNRVLGVVLLFLTVVSVLCSVGRVYAETVPEGLSFQLSFDKGLESTAPNASKPGDEKGEMPLVAGRTGQALRTGAKESFLMYNADGVVQGEQGTVSLWVRPQWDKSNTNFHLFWSLIGNGRFTLYRHGAGGDLTFLYLGKGLAYEQFNTISTSVADWKPSEWHHIAATWDAGEVKLYVDGELKREAVNPNLILPQIDKGTVFFVGDYDHPNYGSQKDSSGVADTDLDEFQLYTRALTANEIATLAGKGASMEKIAPPPPPRVVVPKTANPPKIDGTFTFDEWKDAAGFSGFIDLGNGKVTDRQTGVLLTYDDTNFYVATFAQVPEGAPLKSTNDRRDGPSYGDDSIELHLNPTGSRKEESEFHFIGNSGGAIMDVKEGDTNWNGNWNYRSTIQGNWRNFGQTFWVTELSIPFSELGRTTPRDGEEWLANFARSWYALKQTFTSWTWVDQIRYGTPARFGTLEFREKAPAFQWITLRDFYTGQPVLEGTQFGATPTQLDIATSGQKVAGAELKTDLKMPQYWIQPVDLAGESKGNLQVTAKSGGRLLYSAELPYQLDTQALRVFLSPVPSQERLVVDVDPLRYRKQWAAGWNLQLELTDGKKSYGTQTVKQYQPPLARASFSLRDVPPGSYQVRVRLNGADAKQVAEQAVPFTKPKAPVWMNNKIGVTDRVLKPWTPIEVKNGSLNVWGRDYQFKGNAFPQQIGSVGQTLLRAPIRFVVDGAALAGGREKTEQATGARNVRSGSGQSGNWKVDWKCTAEYDGMLWYEVTLNPGAKAATLQSLSLEMPLRPETSGLYHASNGAFALGGGESGATPAKWQAAWKQVIWLGNEKAGLSWFTESDQHWSLKDRKDAILIERGANGATASIRFVTQPMGVAKPITYRFGLQGTPTRPLPKGWRDWRWSGAGKDTFLKPGDPERATHAISWWMDWSPYISSPFDIKPEAKELVAAHHRAGVKVIPYQALLVINEKAPDYDYFKAEWLNQPQMNGGGEAGQQTWFVNVKGSFQDYFLYALREMVRDQKWDGIYFDFDQGAVPDMNEFHGSGYVDEKGVRRPTYDILAQRQFHKRLWAMLQEELKTDEPIVKIHNSACLVPPVHSFTNVFFDGEQFNFAPKVQDDYTAVVPREMWRAEFLGENFGGAPVLLPELNHLQIKWLNATDPVEKEKARRHFDAAIDTMVMYPMVHGTNFSTNWLDMDYVMPLIKAKQNFDLANVRFHGYWENAKLVTLSPNNPDVVASLYAHDNRFWLVLGNWTAQEQTVTAKVDVAAVSPKLNAASAVTKNVWKEGVVTRAGNGWTLSVPPKAVRIVEISAP